MVFSSLFRKQTPFKSKSETSKKGFKPRCKKHWKKTEVNKKEISQKMPSQGCFLLWPSRREKPRWLVRFNPTTKGVELRLLRYDWFRLQTVSGEVERESERYWQNHDWGLYTREEAVRWLRVILVAAEVAGVGGSGGSEEEEKHHFRRWQRMGCWSGVLVCMLSCISSWRV